MNFYVNIEKLKKEIAFTDSNDLLDSLKHNVDYLKFHNKNTTKAQDNAIDVLYAFINSLSGTNEHTTHIGEKVRVTRTTEDDLLGGVHVGDMGRIIDYYAPDDTVLVEFDDGREWWWWWLYSNQITEVE